VAITAVSGNVTVDQATTNGLRVVQLLNRGDVPVARGLSNPLVRDPVRATSFHGRDGLGDSNLPRPRIQPSEKSALDTISAELASSKQSELSIVCTGPLTNIATLLTGFPPIVKMIKELVIMGGAYAVTEYGIGNVTPVAEFNVYADPEAAKIVFESGVTIKAIGLDVTMNPANQLSLKDYDKIRKNKGKVAGFAAKILGKNIHKHRIFALHDPMTVAVKVEPKLFDFANYGVSVETKGESALGMTIADRRQRPKERVQEKKVMICNKVNSKAFKRLFMDRLIGPSE
jgi:inosine-uridine nucleoside N-ribohydrolase